MKSPSISIVFLCYNQEAFVEEALRSVLNQQHNDFEVIIADDCSTDSTPKVISDVLRDHPNAAKAIRVLPDTNLGIAGNWNRAIQHVRGEYIIAMSGDDVSLPGRLVAVEQAFRNHPEAAAFVSQVTVIDAAGQVLLPGFEASDRRAGLLRNSVGISAYSFWSDAPVIGASAAYRASLVLQFGPLVAGKSEDNSLFYRALLSGSVYYLPKSLVLWRWHGRNASFGAELGNFTADAWLSRIIASKEDALANCQQYRIDAEKANALGLIDQHRLIEERLKIGLLEKLLLVSLGSTDPRFDYAALFMAVWRHLVAERFSQRSIGFGLRSLIRPLLPLSMRLQLSRRYNRLM